MRILTFIMSGYVINAICICCIYISKYIHKYIYVCISIKFQH